MDLYRFNDFKVRNRAKATPHHCDIKRSMCDYERGMYEAVDIINNALYPSYRLEHLKTRNKHRRLIWNVIKEKFNAET